MAITERIIKKYPNRRLYDSTASRYVTLDDVRRLIKDGVTTKVVDAKTDEDLTRSILLQIIVEQEDKGVPMFSTQLLQQVIRFYDDALQTFMGTYLEQSVAQASHEQRALQEEMASIMERAPLTLLHELAERNLTLWRELQEQMLKTYLPGADAKPGPDLDWEAFL